MILLPPPPIEVRERVYHWTDKASDLDLVEVERLTFRVGEDGKTVRERRLLRTEMDGASVPAPEGTKPETLKEGERSQDLLTARIDRIEGLRMLETMRLPEAPPLLWADVTLNPLVCGDFAVGIDYREPDIWKLSGRAGFNNLGTLVWFELEGKGLPLPGGEGSADLKVTEKPVPIE